VNERSLKIPWWAGLDLGGTNLRGVAVDADGNAFWSDQEPIDSTMRGAGSSFGQLGQILDRAIESDARRSRSASAPPARSTFLVA
jgi:predicted NBD/HSP70 family sugar kinase